MTMKKNLVALVGTIALLQLASQGQSAAREDKSQLQAEAAKIASIVDQFYPSYLIDPDYPKHRDSCAGIYDKAADGSPLTIFVVYPQMQSGIRGELLVLHRQSTGEYTSAKVAPSDFDFGAAFCEVDFVDVDGDGKEEVQISLPGTGTVSADFIFRWDGSHLISIGPTERSEWSTSPSLNNPWFINLYDDGTLAAVSLDDFAPVEDAPTPTSIYRLEGGKYAFATHSALSFFFSIGGPESKEFTLKPDSTGPYVLQIANGVVTGEERVSNARVSINGVEVASFSKEVGTKRVPLSNIVAGENTISVDLVGKPGATIFFAVEDHTPDPAHQE